MRAAALACTFIAPVARAQAPQSIGTREGTAPPLRAPLSPEARETLERCVPLDGLRADLVASEPLLTNPVAFFIDRLGRFFVVETDRVNRGVTDLRSHMDWLEEDLAARTVADRVALYRRHSPSDAFEATYAAHEDRVVRLVDRDADGVLDERTVFADGYSRPESGVAAGFLATTPDDGSTDAWFTCIPDLVRMVDSDGDGRANVESVHTTGFGLRVALLGHDLHGLEIGPDARLYFSCGDRGFNVTTAEGRRLVRYGTGAVFRCELDGSDLELFCDGLRNPQELVFDDEGNLFTLDNNSDAGDEARWTFLVEGSDSGWRQAYQWANDVTPRGPWIAEGLCVPHHSDQPAYVLPPIANLTDGPSGMCAYPGTGWGEDWRGAFFVCDFRGNPGYSGIRALWNEPSGAGFTVSRTEKPVWDCLPTDCAFGPDGRLYWTDWITGWGGVGKGRIVALGPERRTEAEARSLEATGRFLARPLAELGAAELVAALRAPDRRVRMRAQLGLAERVREEGTRDGALTLLCAELLRADGAGRRHAAWCAAHVARTLDADDPGRRALLDRLASAFTAADPGRDRGALIPAHVDVLLAQSGDAPLDASVADGFARGALSALRQGASPALVRQRVEAWGRVVAGAPEADTGPVVEALLDERSTRDPWLRASFVRALERHGDPRVAIELLGAESVGARRVGVVVLRRLGHTGVAAALADPDVGVRAEAARAVHDVPIQAALPALARRLEYAGEVHEWTLRRAIHACRAVADERCAARLAAFASDGARDAALRAEALRVLARWGVPATRDGIVRDHRPLAAGDVEVLEVDRLTGGAFGAAVVLLADEGLARAALD
ncbi:MAG: PVC-type heme-binding CxxCH protein, partial [Planctomycetota bacterium]